MSDIKNGYKNTEIGVIPEDWDTSQIRQTRQKNSKRKRRSFVFHDWQVKIIREQM